MRLLKLALALSAATVLLNCTRHSEAPTPSSPAPVSKAPTSDGTSSGGGGFLDENSSRILHLAASNLARAIRRSSPSIYQELPPGWTQEKLAKMIEDVRYEPFNDHPPRDGHLLMFDYGKDAQGPYIVALKPFFVAYASKEIKFAKGIMFGTLFQDIELKLAHESSHPMGLDRPNDDDRSEDFARLLLEALEHDTIVCSGNDPDILPGPATLNFVIHRPSGVGRRFKYTPDTESEALKEVERTYNEMIFRDPYERARFYLGFLDDETDGGNAGPDLNFMNPFSQYHWEIQSSEPNGRLVLLAHKPIHTGETLTLEPGEPGKMQGTLVYTTKNSDQITSLALACRTQAPTLDFPKLDAPLKFDKNGHKIGVKEPGDNHYQ